MTTAIAGKQTTITITGGSPSADLISGCCVKEIGDIGATANTIDVTCHGTNNVVKKVKGLVDLGALDVTIMYKDKTVAGNLYTALKSAESYTCVITIPNTTTETLTFTALITGLSQAQPTEDAITQTISLTLDGETEPTWA